MSDLTDFRLPGHVNNPLSERKLLLSLLAAYSRQWNPRNLEAPWYEPWGQIFADLVAGHASLAAAPQPYLWYDTSLFANQTHVPAPPADLMSTEDEEVDEFVDGVGNSTLDSIGTFSLPSAFGSTRIPDFAITRKVSFPRNYDSPLISLLDRKVTYQGFPLLAELKPSGARCRDVRESLENARRPMVNAQEQLVEQAFHLFRMYPCQESVILVAITGFWWTYRVISREEVGLSDGDQTMDEPQKEVFSGLDIPEQDGIHDLNSALPRDDTPLEDLQYHLYGFYLADIQIPGLPGLPFHTVLQGDEMELNMSWSDFLLYGTAPSNQVFGMIRNRLNSVVHYHYTGIMG